jgi:hypothetical protein
MADNTHTTNPSDEDPFDIVAQLYVTSLPPQPNSALASLTASRLQRSHEKLQRQSGGYGAKSRA